MNNIDKFTKNQYSFTAFGAFSIFLIVFILGVILFNFDVKELFCQFDHIFSQAIAEKAEMSDFAKTCWQDMVEKTSYKLYMRKGHCFVGYGSIVVFFVLECNGAVIDFKNSIIGDGDAVGISGNILQDMFGTCKRLFDIAVPIFSGEFGDKFFKLEGVVEFAHAVRNNELTVIIVLEQAFTESFSDISGHGLYWEQKILSVGQGFPLFLIGCNAAAGDDVVNMNMIGQVLSPCMQDADKTDLRAEEFYIASKCVERLSCNVKEQVIDDLFVEQGDSVH